MLVVDSVELVVELDEVVVDELEEEVVVLECVEVVVEKVVVVELVVVEEDVVVELPKVKRSSSKYNGSPSKSIYGSAIYISFLVPHFCILITYSNAAPLADR